jgi:hypothetical protein
LSLFAITLFSITLTAFTAPFWTDEIFTAGFARLGSVKAIWQALHSPSDAQPVLFYWISGKFLSPSSPEGTLRIPAIAGFAMLMLATGRFVRLAWGATGAIVAALFLINSSALFYGSDARAYGLWIGWSALAALFWQQRRKGDRRSWVLAAFVAALTCACASHYYAVFTVLVFGLSELVLAFGFRRPDWKASFLLPVTIAPVVAALPLLRIARQGLLGAFWAKPSLLSVVAAYRYYLSLKTLEDLGGHFTIGGRQVFWTDFVLPAVLAAFLLVSARRGLLKQATGNDPADLVLASGFFVLPVIIPVAMMIEHSPFTSRYAIPSAIGTSMIAGWLASRAPRKLAVTVGAALTVIFLVDRLPDIAARISKLRSGMTPMAEVRRAYAGIYRAAEQGPVVISDIGIITPSMYYGPPELRERLVYIGDRQRALQMTGSDSWDAALIAGRNVVPVHVEDPNFLRSHAEFTLVTREAEGDWLVKWLRQIGARFMLMPPDSDPRYFRISVDPDAPLQR